MNIFNEITKYGGWHEDESKRRDFTPDEINEVEYAKVEAGDLGNNCIFTYKSGNWGAIPMAKDSTLGPGEEVDLTKAKLITIVRGKESKVRVLA